MEAHVPETYTAAGPKDTASEDIGGKGHLPPRRRRQGDPSHGRMALSLMRTLGLWLLAETPSPYRAGAPGCRGRIKPLLDRRHPRTTARGGAGAGVDELEIGIGYAGGPVARIDGGLQWRRP